MLQNKVEYFLFLLVAKITTLFGFSGRIYLGKAIGLIFYYLIPIRKKVVFKNLSIAFPDFSHSQIKKIAIQNYINFGITLTEIFLIPKLNSKQIDSLFRHLEISRINERIKQGKGLILLTAHYGNWELGAIELGRLLNKSISVLVKPQRNVLVTAWLKKMRESFGNNVITLGAAIKDLYKALLNGGVIGIVGDQRGPKESLRVKIFGIDTAVYIGTAVMAIKSKAPTFVVIIMRKPDYTYEIKIEEIILSKNSDDIDNLILEFNQKYFDILEKYIRQNPEQWFWMHNIWKY